MDDKEGQVRISKLGQFFSSFNAMLAKINKKVLRLVLYEESCLISSS